MMRQIILVCLLLSVLLLPCSQAQQKLALVIGNSHYANIGFLKNPLNDAEDIAKKLRQLQFDVVDLRKNLTKKDMKLAVRNFGKKIKTGDIALFYYAGHGVQSADAENYLIPLKADINDESDLEYHAINASWILSNLQLSKPSLKIMILDACRDNPFRSLRSWRGEASRGLARMSSRGGTIIAYAADEGQKASDGSGRNGLYTQELLKLLGRSGLHASQMFSNVSWQVSNDPNGKGQTPFLSMKAVPPFCFAGCTAPPPRPPQPVKGEKVDSTSDNIVQKPTPPQRLSFEPEMKWIKGGSFKMGSPASEKDRDSNEKLHTVKVGSFWMATTETTFAQWQACVDDGGCQSNKKPKDQGWGRGNRPVINVSWHDANEYANWLSNKTHKKYRLPTEAQWEFAARGGTSSAFSFGNKITPQQANFDGNYSYNGSAKGRYLEKTAAVGSYPANQYGLKDMHGNVWEWTCSAYDKHYGGSENKCGKRNEKRSRVLRGGSWLNLPWNVRSANRNFLTASYRYFNIGFRLSRTR